MAARSRFARIRPTTSTARRTATRSRPVEAGLPIALGYGLTLEPQAQLVWQWLSLDRFNDGISSVSWNNGNTFLGRIGARLQYAFDANGVSWKPYLRVNAARVRHRRQDHLRRLDDDRHAGRADGRADRREPWRN